MIPFQDTAHVTEAGGLITSRYADKKVTAGIVKALTLRIQEVENTFFDFITHVNLANHPFPGGPWNILDQIGTIVGVARNGLNDADYLALIKIKAKVNISDGNPEDILALASFMSPTQPPFYLEVPPAAFYLGCWNLFLNFPLFVSFLAQARPAGVYGMFAYSTWADGGDVEFSSVYDSSAGQTGYGSVYDANAGGVYVAGVGI